MKKITMLGLITGFLLVVNGCVVIPAPPGVHVRLPAVSVGYYGYNSSVHINSNHRRGHRRVHNHSYQGHPRNY